LTTSSSSSADDKSEDAHFSATESHTTGIVKKKRPAVSAGHSSGKCRISKTPKLEFTIKSAKRYPFEVTGALNTGDMRSMEYLVNAAFSENCILRAVPFLSRESPEEFIGRGAICAMYQRLLFSFPDMVTMIRKFENYPSENAFEIFGSETYFSGTECFKAEQGWKNDKGTITPHLDPEAFDSSAVRSVKAREQHELRKGRRLQMSITILDRFYVHPRSKKIVLHELVYKVSGIDFTDVRGAADIYPML
jgi:hypothetical protein